MSKLSITEVRFPDKKNVGTNNKADRKTTKQTDRHQ